MCRLAETQHASSVPRAKLDLADLHVTVSLTGLKGWWWENEGSTRDRPDCQTGTDEGSHDSKRVLWQLIICDETAAKC